MVLSQKRITKALIRRWSASLLFVNLRRQVFSRRGPYVNGGHIIWVCSTSSNTQVIRNHSPHSGGTAGTLIFWLQVPGMTPWLTAHLPAEAWLQMTGVHNLFRLYALFICDHCPLPQPRGMSRTLILCQQFPIVLNHHTVGTASWQKPWQSVIKTYCHGYVSNNYISSALWRQCKSKITAHLQGYPHPAQGLE